jgi:hypothetical protein
MITDDRLATRGYLIEGLAEILYSRLAVLWLEPTDTWEVLDNGEKEVYRSAVESLLAERAIIDQVLAISR